MSNDTADPEAEAVTPDDVMADGKRQRVRDAEWDMGNDLYWNQRDVSSAVTAVGREHGLGRAETKQLRAEAIASYRVHRYENCEPGPWSAL